MPRYGRGLFGENHPVYQPGASVIVQWGLPRTATTAQFMILCYLARLKNFEAGLQPPHCGLIAVGEVVDSLKHGVYKTHHYDLVRGAVDDLYKEASNSVMVFETLPQSADETKKTLEDADSKHVMYSQIFDRMLTCPLSTIHDYSAAFNLTDDQEMRARAHFKYWDVHRLCCGTQASFSYRLQLHGCPPVFKWYDDRQPNCEIYNLTMVEARLNASDTFDSADYVDSDDLLASIGTKTSCEKENDEVRNGAEFYGGHFSSCLSLAKSWVGPLVYEDYKCRNYGCDAQDPF